jgi:hypothetical protein
VPVCYSKTNLPTNPFRSDFDFHDLPITPPGQLTGRLQTLNRVNPVDVLSRETQEIYESLGITPSDIFALGNKPFTDPDNPDHRYCATHRDLKWNGREWKFWIVDEKECYPPEPKSPSDGYFASIHYHKRQAGGEKADQGDPAKHLLLERLDVDCPTVCRTEIAHSIHHNNADTPRYAVTMRFHERLDNWQHVLDVFAPVLQAQ